MVLRSVGRNPSNAEVEKHIGGRKEINKAEFLEIMQTPEESPSEEELLESFKVFDQDCLGFINAPEFRFVFQKYGEKLTAEEFDQVIARNGDNVFRYPMLPAAMLHTRTFTLV